MKWAPQRPEGARPHFFLPHDPQITLPQCLQWCRRWRTLNVLEHVEQTCHNHHQHHHQQQQQQHQMFTPFNPFNTFHLCIYNQCFKGIPRGLKQAGLDGSSRRNSHISCFRGRVQGQVDSPLCSCRAAIGASSLSSAEFFRWIGRVRGWPQRHGERVFRWAAAVVNRDGGGTRSPSVKSTRGGPRVNQNKRVKHTETQRQMPPRQIPHTETFLPDLPCQSLEDPHQTTGEIGREGCHSIWAGNNL